MQTLVPGFSSSAGDLCFPTLRSHTRSGSPRGTTPRATPEAQRINANSPSKLHPDALLRDAERKRRKQERDELMSIEKTTRWWEQGSAFNLRIVSDRQGLFRQLENAKSPLTAPVVINFFSPGCSGCRRMNPKLSQIMEDHSSCTFVKVNTDGLHKECADLGVQQLPFFQIWLGGVCIQSFTCNLTSINVLRRNLSQALAAAGRQDFHTSSISEIVVDGPGVPLSSSHAVHASPPLSMGPAGAVGAQRLPSIDDLVSYSIDSEDDPDDLHSDSRK